MSDATPTGETEGYGKIQRKAQTAMQLIGISGSLRRNSFNTALLRAAKSLTPEGTWLDIKSIAEIPLYNGDFETTEGLPSAVVELKECIVAADGLLIVTPEYNNSVPGVLKNAIDWLTRPPGDIKRVWLGKPVAIVGASPGRFGTILSQNAWLPVMRTLGVDFWTGGRLMVAQARSLFSEDGELMDEQTRTRLQRFMEGFAAFCQEASERRH